MKTRITEWELEEAKRKGVMIEAWIETDDARAMYKISKIEFSENGVGGFDVVITHGVPLPKFRRPPGGTKAVRPPGTTL